MLRLFLGEVKRTPQAQAQDGDDGARPRTVGHSGDSPPLPLDKNFGADLLRTARDKAFDRSYFNALCRVVDKEFDTYAKEGQNCLKVISTPEDRHGEEEWTDFDVAVMLEKLNERYQPCGVEVTFSREVLPRKKGFQWPEVPPTEDVFTFTVGHIVDDDNGFPHHVVPVHAKESSASGGGIKVD